MNDAILLAGAIGFVCLAFAFMAAIADALGEPERWESRRRNGR